MSVRDVPGLVVRRCRDVVFGASPPWVQAKMAVLGGDLRAAASVALGPPGPVLRDRGFQVTTGADVPPKQGSSGGGIETVPVLVIHRVEAQGVGFFDCREDATLVEAGLEAGLELPHSCTLGGCGTCRVRLVSGEVEMEDDESLSQEELAAGDILACVARPRSDVVLRYEED